MKTFAAKGPKEIQSDLPFDQAMPPFKDNILPLEENNISAEDDTSTEGDTDIQTNNVQNEGLLDQENNQEQNEKGGTK